MNTIQILQAMAKHGTPSIHLDGDNVVLRIESGYRAIRHAVVAGEDLLVVIDNMAKKLHGPRMCKACDIRPADVDMMSDYCLHSDCVPF